MAPRRYRHPVAVLAVWAVLLALLFAVTVLYNMALSAYVAQVRATDPHPPLTSAERFIELNRFEDAWVQVEVARERAPEHPRLWKVIGDIHFRRANHREAAEAYQRAVELGSADRGVYANLLWSLIQLQYYQRASELGRRFMQRWNDPVFPRYVAEAFIRRGEREKAVPYLEEALEGNQRDLYLLRNLARAYQSVGRLQEAQEVQRRVDAIEAQQDVEAEPLF
jgi:tetratricopeptide (TPR) repeat protein